MFQLRQAFLTAVLARENLRVAREDLALLDDMERLIRLKVHVGDVAEWDLIKIQAGRVQYQQDLLNAQVAYRRAVRDLVSLLGVSGPGPTPTASDPSSPVETWTDIEPVGDLHAEFVTLSLEDLRQTALENRPDLQAARYAVESARHSVNLAWALRHRDIDVGVEYQRIGSDNTVGLVVSVPLFVFNDYREAIRQAQAQLAQAEAQLTSVQAQVLADVDKAYEVYASALQTLRIYTAETMDRAQASLHIATVAYKEGEASLLELLDAQRTYNQTRRAYNQAQFDYRMSLFQLEWAVGRPLPSPGGTPQAVP